jgi:AraC-like DNA-binding protein
MDGINTLYVVGAALCLFSSSILGRSRIAGGRSLRYLAAYLALECLCYAFELLVAHPAAPFKAVWLSGLMAASMLIAPALWLAVRECIEDERPSAGAVGGFGRAVIVAAGLLTIPLLLTAHSGTEFSDPRRIAPSLLEPIIHETMLLSIALFALQVPHYLWLCRKLVLQNAARNWLQWPLLIVCTAWLLGISRTLMAVFAEGAQAFFWAVALVDVGITVGCVFVIVQRLTSVRPPPEAKYAKSRLDPAVRARIVRKLDRVFQVERAHQESSLSLHSLSARLKENEHYVSQVINQDLGTTFHELVNHHRIEHARRLIAEDPARNVLEVALEVGFNAKSTFNSAFRRHSGLTPREFRLQARQTS